MPCKDMLKNELLSLNKNEEKEKAAPDQGNISMLVRNYNRNASKSRKVCYSTQDRKVMMKQIKVKKIMTSLR